MTAIDTSPAHSAVTTAQHSTANAVRPVDIRSCSRSGQHSRGEGGGVQCSGWVGLQFVSPTATNSRGCRASMAGPSAFSSKLKTRGRPGGTQGRYSPPPWPYQPPYSAIACSATRDPVPRFQPQSAGARVRALSRCRGRWSEPGRARKGKVELRRQQRQRRLGGKPSGQGRQTGRDADTQHSACA